MTEIKKVPASLLKVGNRIEYRGDQMVGYSLAERRRLFTSTITRIEPANRQHSVRLYVCTGVNRYVLAYITEVFTLANDEPTTIDNLMPQMPQKMARTGRRSVD